MPLRSLNKQNEKMTSLKVISHIEDLVLAGNKMISIFSFQTLMFFTLDHNESRLFFYDTKNRIEKKKDLLWQ